MYSFLRGVCDSAQRKVTDPLNGDSRRDPDDSEDEKRREVEKEESHENRGRVKEGHRGLRSAGG